MLQLAHRQLNRFVTSWLIHTDPLQVTCNQSTYFENELSLDEALAKKEFAVFGKPVDETK